MNIILLGPIGSGKGTQAEMLSKKLNLFYLQTGDLARKLASEDSRIKEIVDSGKLIPEEEMTMHVINYLSNLKPDLSNILFEGFPRFISQYEALSNFLKTKGDDIDAVIFLDVKEDEVIKRISARRICNTCGKVYNLITNPPAKEDNCDCGGELIQRADDSPESIRVRLEYYKNNTKELADYLQKLDKLLIVDGSKSIEEVHQSIMNILSEKKII